MKSNKISDILTKIIWNDNVGGISDACLLGFNEDGTGKTDYRELGVNKNEVFRFNYEIKGNKIRFYIPDLKIEFVLNIEIEERMQQNIYDEEIGTEFVLVLDDHPHFLIKDYMEKKQVEPGGGRVEFYQWHW